MLGDDEGAVGSRYDVGEDVYVRGWAGGVAASFMDGRLNGISLTNRWENEGSHFDSRN